MSRFDENEGSQNFLSKLTGGRIAGLVIGVISVFLLIWVASNMWLSMDANEIVVVQAPFSGKLTWHKDAGVKWQTFGKVTRYKKRFQFWFSAKNDQGKKDDESIKIRFNDKGHANISGSISIALPLDDNHLSMLHTQYGSQEAVEHQLIRTVVEKAVYMTGPLMSSQESAAERRSELLQFIEEQVANGVFKTETVQEKQNDPITGQPKTVSVVKLVKSENGLVARSDDSPLKTFGIQTFNPSINEVKYNDDVEHQIQEQQRSTMAVQTSIAMAKKAEQDALTAEKNGQAEAAKAKWLQEVEKAKEVTKAQQLVEVSTLEAKAAEQTKRKLILEGEGEAAKRALIMNADGALDKKLDAYKFVMEKFAYAVKDYQGNWVPTVVSGGNSQAGSGALSMMELLSVKAAHDLGLDLKASGSNKTENKKK